MKNNLVGEGFLKTPAREERRERVNIIGEIDSASGFDYPNLYMFFQVLLSKDWGFEDEVEYNIADPIAAEQTQINKRRSSTHIAKSTVALNKATDEYVYKSHFCFPFDYQLLTPAESARPDPENPPIMMATRWPSLLLQVNSVDSWGRHRIEGYGYVTFPREPGCYEQTISTWRPKGTLYSQVHSYFLGGSVRIIELENLLQAWDIDEVGHKDIVNRFGLETESAGDIKMHFNITRQSLYLSRLKKIVNYVKRLDKIWNRN